jgi:hypothetical protein
MGAALRKIYAGLDGRDDPVLQGASGAISCRLLVGLLRFSVRPPIRLLELTASQVPGVSGQHQFTPGTSAEKPITLPYADFEAKDSCVGLD